MQIKEMVMPATFDTGEATATLINRDSNGKIEGDGLSKEAAAYIRVGNVPEPKPGNSQIHLIIMSDYGVYGPNINGDAYVGSTTSHRLEDGKTIRFPSNGIDDMIQSSLEHGGCYSEHKNSKKKDYKGKAFESVGNVAWANYNKSRERGEVVIEVNTDKWRNTINDISVGKPVYFSHGTTVPYDVCSICGHKARTSNDRCSHIKGIGSLLSHTKKGNQIFTISPEGIMHDVSRVLTPADSMGHGLEKVATDITKLLQNYNPRKILTFSKMADIDDSDTILSAEKLADMEKYMVSQATGYVDSGITEKTASIMASMDDSELCAMMVNEKAVITPDAMASIAIKQGVPIDPAKFSGLCSGGLFSILEYLGEANNVVKPIAKKFYRGTPPELKKFLNQSCKLGDRGNVSRAIRRRSIIQTPDNGNVGMYVEQLKRYANLIANIVGKMGNDVNSANVINIYL